MTIDDPLPAAVEFAGFLLAHAVWSVSEGSSLMPMLGYCAGGERTLLQLESGRIEDMVAQGTEFLAANTQNASHAALIYDGYARLPEGRMDALVADVVAYDPPRRTLQIIVPYRHADSDDGFAVHRPKFQGIAAATINSREITAAFFHGVNSHEEAAPIWNRFLDQSI
ncbi:MAG: hypothetical protein ACREEE_03040 [Dongiaceae bacterium]